MFLKELAKKNELIWAKEVKKVSPKTNLKTHKEFSVAIVGGGFGGVGAAIRLLKAGFTDIGV